MQRLDEKQAADVYAILVECAGASADSIGRDSFIIHFTGDKPTNEWRFCGALGFGGKFRFPRMTVDCYREDENPERLEMIKRTNERLADLHADWGRPLGAVAAN